MYINRLETGVVTVLRLEGDIDEDGVNIVRQAIMDCLRDKRCHVVMNLSKVNFISYMGAGVLVEGLRHVRNFGGDLKFVGANVYAMRLFRMVSIHKMLPLFKTEGQAIQEFQRKAA